MNILLTFAGFHDPYSKGLIGDEEQAGPVLSLINAKAFDKVILFSTPNTLKNTADTEKILKKIGLPRSVESRNINLDDPTDYSAILKELRHEWEQIREENTDASFFISVASGTPQMHACWVLLVASGEIPARILHVRPPRFVTTERPVISEIDLTSQAFPVVRPNICSLDIPDKPLDVDTALRQLSIVGDHPAFRTALEMSAMLAPSNVPVLITGETGTGKEVIAKFTHYLSGRAKESFVPINCAAIPENLVESLLFGHKKGSFTGAVSDQKGKFDEANGGTLFLDELAELPLAIQAKLLRVLQDGLIEPLGDKKPHKVDVRIIAATNKDVHKAIKKGQFREDLYYRLNVGEIHLPSLRERRGDIPKIALSVLDRINSTIKKPKRFAPEALTRLQKQAWPGNIRDLQNVIERSIRLAKKDLLDADDLLISERSKGGDPLSTLPEPAIGFSLEEFIASVRKQMVTKALEAAEGNQSEAARLLGVSPQAVHKFVKKQ